MTVYDRKDHFHQRAKREGYRSRAAFKLLEIQKRQRLLRPGQRVIDDCEIHAASFAGRVSPCEP